MPQSRSFRRLWLFLLAGSLACADRGADTGDAASEPQYGGTIVILNNSDLENLNSLVATDKFTQEMARFAVFLPLVQYAEDLSYEPALAERWELLGDTGVVFHLRRDVRWHDGVQTTARDVLFTYERAKDPETAYPNAEYFASWTGATAPDSFTVRFSFDAHLEPLAGLPFLSIMPAHLLDSIPAARMRQAAFNKAPVGNGPFRFVEYRANDRWIFEANPDFSPSLGGRPWLDRIVWRGMPDATAQAAELTTGSADVALTPQSLQYSDLAARPGLRGIERTGRQYGAVIWNHRVAPLNDARVRRALTMAINREQILETLRSGYGTVAVGPIGPYHWAYDESLPPLPFDRDSARALLAEAGIRNTDADSTLELPNGSDFEIELKIPAGSIINREMAEMIRADLSTIGVHMTTQPTDFATLIGDVTGPARNFEGVILGWESDFRINLRDVFHSDAIGTPNQTASYSNPRVDSLIDQVALTRTREEALPLYHELQRILRNEQPWTFLYYYPDLVLVSERLQGVEMDIRGALRNIRDWWVTDAQQQSGAQAPSDSAARSPARDSAPAR